jgi:hypothetical protein
MSKYTSNKATAVYLMYEFTNLIHGFCLYVLKFYQIMYNPLLYI